METFSALLAICAGNSPVIGEFPEKRPVARSFDVFFDLPLNKRLSKQSRVRWWFGTIHRAHYDVTVMNSKFGHIYQTYIGPWEMWQNLKNIMFKLIIQNISLGTHYDIALMWMPQNLLIKINIGSGNGLVWSGNKPLPEAMLTLISVTIWCH